MPAKTVEAKIAEGDIPARPQRDGSALRIVPNGIAVLGGLMITDGERTAIYIPMQSGVSELLHTATLRIVPDYTEAGWLTEANVITVTDGERTALYVRLRKVERAA